MTASDILRIATTIGVVQLLCDLTAHWLVFSKESYQRALSNLSRTKAKLDKEKQSSAPKETTTTTSKNTGAANKDKHAKKLKRAEEEYSESLWNISKLHFVPNFLTSIMFFLLLRIFGAELKGKVIAILPFVPFSIVTKLTGRGLVFHEGLEFESTNPAVVSVHQACSLMFIYMLSTLSIKFYVNKLLGTKPPAGADSITSFAETAQGKGMMQAFGIDPNAFKED